LQPCLPVHEGSAPGVVAKSVQGGPTSGKDRSRRREFKVSW
jgi:hypothetical protein